MNTISIHILSEHFINTIVLLIMMTDKNQAILIYDGYCNLCSSLVGFIYRKDKKNKIRYLAFQSTEANILLSAASTALQKPGTVYFLINNQVLTKSGAALTVLKHIGNGWQFLYFLVYLPPFIRDAVYDWAASIRYRFFGKRKTCFIVE